MNQQPQLDLTLFSRLSSAILMAIKDPLYVPIEIRTPNGLVHEELYENLRHL